jgi:valyl-tRNA synthetase
MDKRYDHTKFEAESRDLWDKENIFSFNANNTSSEVYSIDTPPPTVSGTLHIGHVFSYTHTDIIARYKRMQGYNVYYPMGFDDNGLPTERFVEKKNKTKAHLMKRSEFISLCLKDSVEIEKEFVELWKMMGLSIDWKYTYSTISDKVRKIAQYSFLQLYEKDLVYRQYDPALYCTTCKTSVAQAELDSVKISSNFNDIEFSTEDGVNLLISTTRPELLPACVAIFFHPDDNRYKVLNGKFAITPIFNKKVKILADEKVDPEKGTGLVMCCTFGDQTDVYWFKKHNLPFTQVVGYDGKWTSDAGQLEGLRVHDARKKIIELLKNDGKLLDQKPIQHNVNTHERCNQEIEYLIFSQWFVKILDNKNKFLELAEKINWKPEFMKARYKDWVENLNWDWCISRQRFYGVPFPVWHCSSCKNVLVAQEKDLPIDPQESTYPGGVCPKCSSKDITPDTDVMDTWNTSALTPQINSNWPEGNGPCSMPMNLRPQAHDIIRTWTFSTIVKSYYHNNQIPWKDIVISGHVKAGKEKISKSKGENKLDPNFLLKQYPADVIRFWSASGKLGMDTAFSENQFKIGQRLVTKLWNAFRFCKEIIDPNKEKPEPVDNLGLLNEWILHELSIAVREYKKQFDDYEYSNALDVVEKFFWHSFCDNYLELIKDQIFNPERYNEETISATNFTVYEVCFAILQLYAPILSHITEAIYQQLFKDKEQATSLHITVLDDKRCGYEFGDSNKLMAKVLEIVSQVRKLKSENQLSLKTELSELTICFDDQILLNQMQTQTDMIAGITKAEAIEFKIDPKAVAGIDKPDDTFVATVKI